jgi:probable rRNA maturation factor
MATIGQPKARSGPDHSMSPDGLRVIVGDANGRPVRMAGLSSWLRRASPVHARGRVSIALVSDQRIRALNRTYRKKDYATDVLSFPSSESPPRRTRSTQSSRPAFCSVSPVSSVVASFLGEIVIARGVARRQARRAGHSELTELRVLALHGLLHLLGYDHEHDTGEMSRVEERLRRKGGLREGLIAREAARSRPQ